MSAHSQASNRIPYEAILIDISKRIGAITESHAAKHCNKGCASQDQQWCEHDGGWKIAIFKDMVDYFKSYPQFASYYTCATASEFLLDFVLVDTGTKTNPHKLPVNVLSAVIGMEVEWSAAGTAPLEPDFNKLLCFNAPIKIFVYTCQSGHRTSFEQSVKPCLEGFRRHQEGDQYLIVEFYKDRTSNRKGSRWSCRGTRFVFQNGQVSDSLSIPVQ